MTETTIETDLAELLAGGGGVSGGREAWLALAAKALSGRDPMTALKVETLDGIALKPLYARDDVSARAARGPLPSNRPVWADGRRPWDIRQRHAFGDAKAANAAILDDLNGGVTSITLQIEAPGQFGLAPRYDAIAEALGGVHLDMVGIALEAGEDYIGAAQALATVWDDQKVADVAARGAFNADPLGALARVGSLEDNVHGALQTLAHFAAANVGKRPGVRVLLADGRPYHNAGASEAEEIAAVLGTVVCYLRALAFEGISSRDAFPAMSLALATDTDQFLSMVKLRALRLCLTRIAEKLAAGDAANRVELVAETSQRMLAAREPHINMLRTTIACAGAALGGADAITVLPFTWALGQPDALARRMARNTQIILQEESSLDRVADPAAGAWYVDQVTDELARKAWALFQDIEKRGGMEYALKEGIIQDRIAQSAERRAERLADGRDEVIGVSTFAHVDAVVALVSPHPRAGAVRETGERVDPLPQRRTSASFETLRARIDAIAASKPRPEILLVCLGAKNDHTAREAFMRNLVAVAGFSARSMQVSADITERATEIKMALSDGDAAATGIVCLCGSDADYATDASPIAEALVDAGARDILFAGRPGEMEAALTRAGVSVFVHARSDRLDVLARLVDDVCARAESGMEENS